MRQQVHRNAATDIRQSGQLMTPEMLVQHDPVAKRRHWAGARLGIANTARRGLDAADGQCGLLIAHGSVLLKCWAWERHICFPLRISISRYTIAIAVCQRPFAEHSRVLRRASRTGLSEASALEGAMKPGRLRAIHLLRFRLAHRFRGRWGLTIKGNPHSDTLPRFIYHNEQDCIRSAQTVADARVLARTHLARCEPEHFGYNS